MISIAKYNIKSGHIISFLTLSENFIDINISDEEDYYLNCPTNATHILNNSPITIAENKPNAEDLLIGLRNLRRDKLIECDWTQMSDTPLSPEKKAEWATYRQALRDFPDTCDPENPRWPPTPN